MAEHLPTLTIPPKRRPSFLNSGLLFGAAIGAVLTPLMPFTLGGAALVGTAMGSWLGKRKMQREVQTGVQVSPPSSWNKGTFFGAIAGIASIGIAALAGASILGVALAGWPLVGIMAGATMLGGAVFGQIGKAFQNRTYKAAEAHIMQYGEYVPPPSREQLKAQQQAVAMEQEQAPQPPQRQQPRMLGQPAALNQAHQQINPEQLARLQTLITEGQRMTPPQPETMAGKVGHSRPQGPQER